MKGKSTTDQLFTLRQILEKTWEFNISTYQVFVDFKQAYDSIDRGTLLATMADFEIPQKLISMVHCTLSHTWCQVGVQSAMSESFETVTGLRQGDSLSPMLFNIALEKAIRNSQIESTGNIYYKSIQLLGYADDLNIIGRSVAAVKEAYGKLEESAKEIGLAINKEKTKVMAVTPGIPTSLGNNLDMGNHNLEVVQSFKYLGSTVTEQNEEEIEIKNRIMQANRAYFSLSTILKSKVASKHTKCNIYKTIIRPILVYGSETWTLTQKTENRLATFERKILRKIYGAIKDNNGWRIRMNHELYRLYKSADVIAFVKLNRLRWAGHVSRMAPTSMPKRILANPEGRRNVGRPRTRWEECVSRDAREMLGVRNWGSVARDRDAWGQRVVEAKARCGL